MARYNVTLDGVSVVVEVDGDAADAIAAGKAALEIHGTCKQQSAEVVSSDATAEQAQTPAPSQESVGEEPNPDSDPE